MIPARLINHNDLIGVEVVRDRQNPRCDEARITMQREFGPVTITVKMKEMVAVRIHEMTEIEL